MTTRPDSQGEPGTVAGRTWLLAERGERNGDPDTALETILAIEAEARAEANAVQVRTLNERNAQLATLREALEEARDFYVEVIEYEGLDERIEAALSDTATAAEAWVKTHDAELIATFLAKMKRVGWAVPSVDQLALLREGE